MPVERIDPSMSRDEAQAIAIRVGADLAARRRLVDLAEYVYNVGQRKGAAILLNAERYLSDRENYERITVLEWPFDAENDRMRGQ